MLTRCGPWISVMTSLDRILAQAPVSGGLVETGDGTLYRGLADCLENSVRVGISTRAKTRAAEFALSQRRPAQER